jgi:predicted RecA/RadA family phage recombinase
LRKSVSLVSILPLAFFCATLHGQTQGEITGEATDPSGAVVPGVTVTVTNTDTNATRQMQTNASGVFDFPSLLPGSYSLRAEGKGFQAEEQTGIDLQVQQVIRANFTMKLGQENQTVTVSAAAALLSPEDVTVGTVIGTKRITDLPLNGREFLQLVALSPNVVYGFAAAGQQTTIQGGLRASTTISIAGQRAEFNYYTLDGLNDTDDNFNDYLLLPSIDALQEFKVQYGIYPAEYGRNVGQINVSTKSGTNEYHGVLFDFVRNSVMDATSYQFTSLPPAKSPLTRNQFGFTLGGPVRIPRLFNGTNRLFFMTNYEGQRWYTQLVSTAIVPTLQERGQLAGDAYFDFSDQTRKIYDPQTQTGTGNNVTATQFPNNQIPLNRQDGSAKLLMTYYPQPNVAGALAGQTNYQIQNSQIQNADQFTARIDLTENDKSTWFGRYSWSNESDLTPSTFPGQGNILDTVVHQSALGNTRVLTPAITNEFLFGYSGLRNYLITQGAFTQNVVGALGGIQGLAPPTPITYGIPAIGITSYTSFGDSSTAPDTSNDHVYEAIDNLTMVRGKHTFQFGAEWRRDQYNQQGNQFVAGNFNFTGNATDNPVEASTTGNAFADFVLGLVNNSAGTVVPLAVAQLRATNQFYYAEDTWKILPNLTITPGLRYENIPPFWSKHDELMNTQLNTIPQTSDFSKYDPANPPVVVRQGSDNNFYAGLPWRFGPGIVIAQDGRMGKRLVNPDNTMFAPRLGLAYSPTGNWVVRTGFGIFYAQDVGNAVYDMSRNLAVRRNVTGRSTYPNLTLENPFGLPPGDDGLTVTAPTILSNYPTKRAAYQIQYELNVQRQLSPKMALEVGYLGGQGHHLNRFRNFNVPLPEAGNPQANRPDPLLGAIQEGGQDYVNSTYNSLEIKFTHNMSRGLNALVGYTWARSIDIGSAIRSHGGDEDFAQNPYCVTCGERGPSNFNQDQRLVTSLLYEPPIGKGHAFLTHGIASEVLGGWQFNSIFTIASGLPFTFTESASLLNGGGGASGGGGGRPDYSGSTLVPGGGKNRFHWFNPAGYKAPPLYAFGNVSRNSMDGPGELSWDSSMMKLFRVYREQDLQFRFEAFNTPNHPNFGLPNASQGSATFGQITSLSTAVSMRQLQLSLKYIF